MANDRAPAHELGDRLSGDASGFWRHWPLHKILVLAALTLSALPMGLGARRGAPGLIIYLFVWNWIAHDRPRHPDAVSRYRGLAFFLLWPVLIVSYLVETRGWKRALIGLSVAWAAALAGFLMGSPAL